MGNRVQASHTKLLLICFSILIQWKPGVSYESQWCSAVIQNQSHFETQVKAILTLLN